MEIGKLFWIACCGACVFLRVDMTSLDMVISDDQVLDGGGVEFLCRRFIPGTNKLWISSSAYFHFLFITQSVFIAIFSGRTEAGSGWIEWISVEVLFTVCRPFNKFVF